MTEPTYYHGGPKGLKPGDYIWPRQVLGVTGNKAPIVCVYVTTDVELACHYAGRLDGGKKWGEVGVLSVHHVSPEVQRYYTSRQHAAQLARHGWNGIPRA